MKCGPYAGKSSLTCKGTACIYVSMRTKIEVTDGGVVRVGISGT